MAVPFLNLRSKIDRAISAYLISAGAGTINDTFPAASKAIRAYPSTTVHAGSGKPEVRFTGSYRVLVYVSIKATAVEQVGNTKYDLARQAFDERVAKVCDALMQSDDGQTLRATAKDITAAGRALKTSGNAQIAQANKDMDEFTCQSWYDAGFGDVEIDDTAWEETLIFEAVCCASNVD